MCESGSLSCRRTSIPAPALNGAPGKLCMVVRWFLPSEVGTSGASIMLQPALLSLASVASQCPKLSLAVPARDAANTLQASLSGWSVPQVEWRASSYCSKAVDAFQVSFEPTY